MANHIGSDFTPPDVYGKVTGSAKYAEDIHVDGMVFARLLTSPHPHARVLSMDLSEALAMEGVVGALTADDVPAAASPPYHHAHKRTRVCWRSYSRYRRN